MKLYEKDFYAWTQATAKALKAKNPYEIFPPMCPDSLVQVLDAEFLPV